jgi:hypothetical protein
VSRSKGGILEGAGGEKGMEKFGGPAPVNETTASGLVRLGRDEEKNDSGIAHRATTKKRESERERKRKREQRRGRKQWTRESDGSVVVALGLGT